MSLKTIKLGNRKRVIPIHADDDTTERNDIIAAMRAIIKHNPFDVVRDRAALLRYLDQLERMS